MVKTYVKGFKIDRKKVADVADVESDRDAEVDAYIRVILSGLNRSGYKFIAAAHEHTPPGQIPDGRTRLALIIVLEEGSDEETLRGQGLECIDESINFARPHVLIGPDVWELWG